MRTYYYRYRADVVRVEAADDAEAENDVDQRKRDAAHVHVRTGCEGAARMCAHADIPNARAHALGGHRKNACDGFIACCMSSGWPHAAHSSVSTLRTYPMHSYRLRSLTPHFKSKAFLL